MLSRPIMSYTAERTSEQWQNSPIATVSKVYGVKFESQQGYTNNTA